MEGILNSINNILWSFPLVVLVLGSGIYFSLRMKFPQFRYLKEMFRIMSKGSDTDKGMSPLKAFIFTAARTVGVGNIAGMATAIFFGGPGAVFWLWILAIFGSAVALIEGILAQTFHETVNGELKGGPAYYMEKGFRNKKVGKVFAVVYAAITMISMPVFCSTVQSYNIAHGMSEAIGIPVVVVGALLTLLMGITIFGGIKRIGNTAKRISPIMAVIYVLMTLIVVGKNITRVPEVFALIFQSAFGVRQAYAGILGATVTWGIKRGVFANEVGIGTSAITGAIGDVNHPVKQGLLNSLSVFIGTFFVCTTSALMMLMTGCYNVIGPDGAMIYEGLPGVPYGNGFVTAAIDTVIPGFGKIFVALAILSFSFVALLAYYVYGESNILYLTHNKTWLTIEKIALLTAVFLGSIFSADVVWTIGDIGNAAMAWVNIFALLIIGNLGIRIFNRYDKDRKQGVEEPSLHLRELGIESSDWELKGRNNP